MPNIPIEDLLRFYKDVLLLQRVFLEPSVIAMIESTIDYLEKYKVGF